MSTLPFSALATGHPTRVSSASRWNVASSTFGTLARTSSCILVIVKPAPTFSIVQRAVVSILVAGVPFFSRFPPSAMLKQAASAAASSSSGFEPVPSSKRELKLYWPARPVCPLKLPRPPLRPPSHFALAVRVGIVLLLELVRRLRDLTPLNALT